MISDELDRLQRLRNEGTLTEEEFQQAKQKLLSGNEPGGNASGQIYGMNPNTWNMLMHLSQLLAFLGGIGIAAPIIMWAISKDQNSEANKHGLVIINWLISSLIYVFVGSILLLVIIGIPLLIAVGICSIVFPIIGAMKANTGEVWRYPLSIDFFRPTA